MNGWVGTRREVLFLFLREGVVWRWWPVDGLLREWRRKRGGVDGVLDVDISPRMNRGQ